MYSMFMHRRSGMTIAISPSHPYNAGPEHVGFSPTGQSLPAASAERNEVREGRRIGLLLALVI